MELKYPYDTLESLKELAKKKFNQIIDLSIGSPVDEPFITGNHEEIFNGLQSYPPSKGIAELCDTFRTWLKTNYGVNLKASQVASCVGTKEFVASLPRFLKLLYPQKNTVIYNRPSYPTYKMSALLNDLKGVAVDIKGDMLDFNSLNDEEINSTLCLFINSPNNPTGKVLNLEEIVSWTNKKKVLLISDECYCDFYWKKDRQSVLQLSNQGVLALFSISKRSNLAGARIGFYAGDEEIISSLTELRKHWGLIPAGSSQKLACLALKDEAHVTEQRNRYFERLKILKSAFENLGLSVEMPEGGIYLWIDAQDHPLKEKANSPDWVLASYLAEEFGVIVSPGSFYEDSSYIRVAATALTQDVQLFYKRVEQRLA
jgi:aspartate/methionine/tyrosine aminotransferase